jgi:two-component system sensor histidine kinase RegB
VTSRPQGKARRALAAQIAASVAAAAPGRKGKKAAGAAPAAEKIAPSQGGMGLGFFIARTLLERTGGRVSVGAGDGGKGQPRGARVAIRWPRPALEVSP